MPCMGPNLDWSRQVHAPEIANAILALLREKYHMGSGSLDEKNNRWTFNEELKAKLLAVIEEIAVDDACASF